MLKHMSSFILPSKNESLTHSTLKWIAVIYVVYILYTHDTSHSSTGSVEAEIGLHVPDIKVVATCIVVTN